MVADCASEKLRDTDQLQQTPKRVRHKTQRRREQCRANQARYRQKQLNHSKSLEEAVQKLRADIPVLELQRNRLLHGDQQSLWNVVVEYFHNFRFGVPVALPLTMEGEEIYPPSKTPESVENAETKHQLAFLLFSMTDGVVLTKRTGVEALE